MEKIKLKGGSLSSTYFCKDKISFIRKEINLKLDREYGFVRWYSQLKKTQRFYSSLPELFPKILNVSYADDTAYFDIEYFDGYKNVKQILNTEILADFEIKEIVENLWISFDSLHKNSYPANHGASLLYFKEEIDQKLMDACSSRDFKEFFNYTDYEYCGKKVSSINKYYRQINNFFEKNTLKTEEWIHGNPTLENLMYNLSEKKFKFIDLYEESIIDSKYLDYSQVLQCSKSYYGQINDGDISVIANKCSYDGAINKNFEIFNNYFIDELLNRNINMQLIAMLEASQFIRMLPFKIKTNDINKAKFFYVHACYLYEKVFLNGQ